MAFAFSLNRRGSLTLAALAMTTLGGCYDGGVYGASDYASGYACGSDYYDSDPYGYDDGYGYGCYDPTDYRGGFVQIGFGGGWYDDYYYPGYGTWMYDRYNVRRPLGGHYLNYWGGRRAYHRHHQSRPDRFQGRPGRPAPDYAPNRPGTRPDGATRPGRPGRPDGATRPGRPQRPDGATRPDRPNRPDGATRPGRPQRPDGATRPGRPSRPDGATRPGRPSRPDGATRPNRPGGSAAQPSRNIRDVIAPRDQPARPPVARPQPQREARPVRQARPQREARPQRRDRPQSQRD